jgi:predicted RNA binding protein YcfA (HicA-like mRNA interferase family)
MKRVTGREMCRALEKAGWKNVRTRGSHFIFDRPGALRTIPVPVHGSKLLKPGTQKGIMREAGLTDADL